MSHRYIHKIEVAAEHLDGLNHVNNVQYLLWAQDIAKSHWEKIKGLHPNSAGVWMVRSHQVNYRLGAFLEDTLIIETYVKEIRGPLSLRVVDFLSAQTNKVVVNCNTQWCYVDPDNRKPLRIPLEISNSFLSPKPPY